MSERMMTHYVGDTCQPPHRAVPGSWVAIQAKPDSAHHLKEEVPGGVITECGQRIERPDYDPPDYLSECRSCAEHIYARDNRLNCSHCGKRPRGATPTRGKR